MAQQVINLNPRAVNGRPMPMGYFSNVQPYWLYNQWGVLKATLDDNQMIKRTLVNGKAVIFIVDLPRHKCISCGCPTSTCGCDVK